MARKKLKPGLYFEMIGKVYFVEVRRGKRPKRTELKGELVLRNLVQALEEGLELLAARNNP